MQRGQQIRKLTKGAIDKRRNMIKNIDRMHPIKREKILKGLRFLEKMDADGIISKVILFGSAATDHCTVRSDIDICLVTDEDSRNRTFFWIFGGLPMVMDDLCDIVVYRRLSGKLKEEIDRKGIVIYEYTGNSTVQNIDNKEKLKNTCPEYECEETIETKSDADYLAMIDEFLTEAETD